MKGMAIDAKKYHQAGKGASPRRVDREKYDANYDRIFRKQKEQNNEPENT